MAFAYKHMHCNQWHAGCIARTFGTSMTYSLIMRDKIRLLCSPANIAALPPSPMDWRRFALGLADSTLIFLRRYGSVRLCSSEMPMMMFFSSRKLQEDRQGALAVFEMTTKGMHAKKVRLSTSILNVAGHAYYVGLVA